MTAVAWFGLGLCAILIALAPVVHTIRRLENESRDTLENILDAVLTPRGDGEWVTPLPPEFAEWDAEMHDHLNQGGDYDK